METELQTAMAMLARYRRLQINILDGEMLRVLDNLVQEMQQRIAKLEKPQPLALMPEEAIGTSI